VETASRVKLIGPPWKQAAEYSNFEGYQKSF
jgi:hypothetical protein